ncbi:MAG: hypothetical protein DYH08_15150 [Actinobacteria bacterium ATB1]|nr:hypothetical protein [Actinobacteria bacterium ATB1]
MQRTSHLPIRLVRSAGRLLASLSVVAWLFVGRVSTVLAQVQRPESEIPENAPKNWSIQFVAEPLLILTLVVVAVCIVAYVWRMVRLRYPRPS